MAVNSASRVGFYVEPRVAGASEFALGIGGLAIPNVAAMGHRFRYVQGDPGAVRLERQRRATAQATGTVLDAATVAIPERVNRAPNFLPAVFLDLGAAKSRCVCKIETDGVDFEGVQGSWFGTGFLVAGDILLTNHHVLNSIATCRRAWCIFNYQAGADARPMETVAVRLEPDRLFLTSPIAGGLDYTFVGIDARAGEQFGHVPLVRSAFTVHPGDAANIVQHPDGRHKEVTLQENEVVQDTGVLLHYASDTLGGSSGAPVFNNRWELIALHHACRSNEAGLRPNADLPIPEFLNEGIKISAIATDLETRAESAGGAPAARAVLRTFAGVDSLMGYFGGLGRTPVPGAPGLERVVHAYGGEGADVDVGFWQADWLAQNFEDKVGIAARVVASLNLDVWALIDAAPMAVDALVAALKRDYDLEFGHGFALDAPAATDPATALLWNVTSVEGARLAWPGDVAEWFRVDSRQFDSLRLDSAHGPVFDRYPGLFRIRSRNRPADTDPFGLRLVPLALGGGGAGGGSRRQRMATKILAAAIRTVVAGEVRPAAEEADTGGAAGDWLIGGCYDAEAASADLREALGGRLAPLSAAGTAEAVTYLKSARSLVRQIFVSPNVSRRLGAEDVFDASHDRPFPDYLLKLCERPPVLLRLGLADHVPAEGQLPASLAEALGLARVAT